MKQRLKDQYKSKSRFIEETNKKTQANRIKDRKEGLTTDSSETQGSTRQYFEKKDCKFINETRCLLSMFLLNTMLNILATAKPLKESGVC